MEVRRFCLFDQKLERSKVENIARWDSTLNPKPYILNPKS